MKEIRTHGGRREGAGRKSGSSKYGEATTPVRIPVSLKPFLNEIIQEVSKGINHKTEKILKPCQDMKVQERPLFLTAVPAGFPSPADDHIDLQLDLNHHFHAHTPSVFYCRVSGESMKEAGIFDGDILVVDRSLEARSGDIVIAIVDSELTVKRLYRKDGIVELRPENAYFQPLSFSDGQDLMIWGVVTGVTRKFR